MQVQIDAQNFELNSRQEHALGKKLRRLGRLIKMFKSSLVNLHVHLDLKQPPEGYVTKVNLSVPHKQMAAQTENKKFSLSVGEAFKKVIAQLRNYRGRLKEGKRYAEVAREKGKM